MIQYKRPSPIIKALEGLDTSVFPLESSAANAIRENEAHREIAKSYFSQTPTIQNLAKGVYHWLRGNILSRSEDPDDYRYIGGTLNLPILSKLGIAASTAEAFEQGVYKGFLKGLAKGGRLAQKAIEEAIEEATKGKVSKDAAKRYAEMRASKAANDATKGMYTQEQLDAQLNTLKATAQAAALKLKERAFDVGKRWGQSHAPALSTLKVTNAETTKTNTGDGFWGTTRKVLWETNKNNFGNMWRWRNAGRIGLSPITVPFAVNGLSGAAGVLVGIGLKNPANASGSFSSGYNLIMGSDNTNEDLPSTPSNTETTLKPDTVVRTPRTSTTEGAAVVDEMRQRLKNDF